jgi:hypothetical protein
MKHKIYEQYNFIIVSREYFLHTSQARRSLLRRLLEAPGTVLPPEVPLLHVELPPEVLVEPCKRSDFNGAPSCTTARID